jgi:hypothetical protein
VLRDLTGSYEVPFAVAALLLFVASLVSFAVQERQYSARYQTVSASPLPSAEWRVKGSEAA